MQFHPGRILGIVMGLVILATIFLIPFEDRSRLTRFDKDDPAYLGSSIYQYAARRQVWTDLWTGAAVQWMPSYYKIWWPRYSETRSLVSHEDKMTYARQKGIDYVLEVCAQGDQEPPPVFSNELLCLYAAKQ